MRNLINRAPLPTTIGAVLAAATLAGCARGESAEPVAALTLVQEGAGNPTVAIDGRDGTALVVWVGTADGEPNVFLARVAADGRRLGEPVRVNSEPGDASLREAAPPQVAIGPAGEVYVAWESSYPVEGRRFPASDLRFARSGDGGRSFEPSVTVNSDAGGIPASHTFHNIVVALDGTVYVAWLDSRERDRVRSQRATSGSTAAHGEAGDAHAAHSHTSEADLPGSELWLAVSGDGGASFSEGSVVDRGVCPCCRVGLATAADGAVYIAWRKIFDGDVRDIALARSVDGGRSFGEPVRLHDDGWVYPGCPRPGPSVAVAADGGVHVAWYTGKPGGQGVFYAASADGGRSFGPPIGLIEAEWIPPSHARLAARGNDVWVAWDDRREDRESRQVFLARVQRGASAPRVLPETVLRGSTPDLVLARETGVLAWQAGEAVRVRFIRGER